MPLTDEQIVANWEKLLNLVKNEVAIGEKQDALLKMLNYFEDRMSMAPASQKDFFHNSFEGGLVDHTLRLIEIAKKMVPVWVDAGATIDFSAEELIIAGILHDFGKSGDMENTYYVPNESEWHRKNQGLLYKMNKKMKFMYVSDRTFFLCLQFGVKLSESEYLAIRLADGLYAKTNEGYLMVFDDELRLKTNLPHIIHHADMLAARVEYQQWKIAQDESAATLPASKSNLKRKNTWAEIAQATPGLKLDTKLFDELFKEKSGGK